MAPRWLLALLMMAAFLAAPGHVSTYCAVMCAAAPNAQKLPMFAWQPVDPTPDRPIGVSCPLVRATDSPGAWHLHSLEFSDPSSILPVLIVGRGKFLGVGTRLTGRRSTESSRTMRGSGRSWGIPADHAPRKERRQDRRRPVRAPRLVPAPAADHTSTPERSGRCHPVRTPRYRQSELRRRRLVPDDSRLLYIGYGRCGAPILLDD
jgi:hypothetical protein